MASAFLRIFLVATFLIITVVIRNFMNISKPLPIPQLDMKKYWGAGTSENYKEDKTIRPFKISYTKEIDELKSYLSRPLNLPPPLEEVGFEYGFNSNKLKNIVEFWRYDYLPRWKEREGLLNSFQQYETQIQGLRIHYIHVKPQLTINLKRSKIVLPLLLIHGWPGSVKEFYEIIPKLTSPNSSTDYVFEVIAPSLPGYGWSQAASKKGLGPSAIAIIFKNLMSRIGHEKFLVQGGDWGSVITSIMATLFPNNIIGAHSNFCFIHSPSTYLKMFVSSLFPTFFVTTEQMPFHFPLSSKLTYIIEESGYYHLQTTKPDTIGMALTGNPIGLAAYILEKFSTWTNPSFKHLADGGLEKKFKMDDLLDNIMIYYLTNSITTSQRIYAESIAKSEMLDLDRVQTNVPYGCAKFRHELYQNLDWQLKDKYTNLIHSTYHADGGHFAAFELPDILYNDFIRFVEKVYSSTSEKKTEL